MRKVNRDPFSNGTEHMMFEAENCDKCIKNSVWVEALDRYTNADEDNMPNRCSILRDIIYRMVTGNPINERTVRICDDFIMRGKLCPFLKTVRRAYRKKVSKEQLTLEL